MALELYLGVNRLSFYLAWSLKALMTNLLYWWKKQIKFNTFVRIFCKIIWQLTCMWALRFPFCENIDGQKPHWYGLSPVCFVRWICSAPFWLNAFSQTWHLYGFSPKFIQWKPLWNYCNSLTKWRKICSLSTWVKTTLITSN